MAMVVGEAHNGVNGGGGTAAVSESMATLHSTPSRFLRPAGRGRRGGAVKLLVGARGGRRRRGFAGEHELGFGVPRDVAREEESARAREKEEEGRARHRGVYPLATSSGTAGMLAGERRRRWRQRAVSSR